MYDYYFTFRSMLPAQRAAAYLQEQGLSAAFLRSPAALAKHGCGYAVLVKEYEAKRASFFLLAIGMSYEKILKRDSAGVFREVFL